MQNFQPVRVWTVNFTLSFSDRASEISTCRLKSTMHDECPVSDGSGILGKSYIITRGVYCITRGINLFYQECLFLRCPINALVYQGVCITLPGISTVLRGQIIESVSNIEPGVSIIEPGRFINEPGVSIIEPGMFIIEPGVSIIEKGDFFQ